MEAPIHICYRLAFNIRVGVPAALAIGCAIVLLSAPVHAQGNTAPVASDIELIDLPDDDGTALLLLFSLSGHTDDTRVQPEVLIDGEWLPGAAKSVRMAVVSQEADWPEYFGWKPGMPDRYVLTVNRYMEWVEPTAEKLEEDPTAEAGWQPVGFSAGEEREVRLVVDHGGVTTAFDSVHATTREEWFNRSSWNNLILCIIFATLIMGFILAARRNPNLFIRRISGLEAVDEAIGRATEMGRPVMHINGLDPLSNLATIAAVNILGRIARRVANYDSELLVPCFDPVVMTVSQEVVKSAYIEAGRPDAYREENIYFLTDQQFSYTASVCGIMVRQKPAANFLLGYFYAESLVLAETGNTTGAIQIAGTDALAQLPFFITTCDYTLIGEELYAASAYLSREPMLLGSLKGQDVGKAFVMAMIIVGSILATFGIDWLTQMVTPL